MVVVEVQTCGPVEAVTTVLYESTVDGELDTVVLGLTYVGSIATYTGGRRKCNVLQQVGSEHVVVLDGTVDAVVEQSIVKTEVPGL